MRQQPFYGKPFLKIFDDLHRAELTEFDSHMKKLLSNPAPLFQLNETATTTPRGGKTMPKPRPSRSARHRNRAPHGGVSSEVPRAQASPLAEDAASAPQSPVMIGEGIVAQMPETSLDNEPKYVRALKNISQVNERVRNARARWHAAIKKYDHTPPTADEFTEVLFELRSATDEYILASQNFRDVCRNV